MNIEKTWEMKLREKKGECIEKNRTSNKKITAKNNHKKIGTDQSNTINKTNWQERKKKRKNEKYNC